MEPATVVVQQCVLEEIFQLNIQGIHPKVVKQKVKLKTLGEFVATSKKKIPFFILTESHLKAYILDAEITIPNYNILRADRTNRRNGGVIIYVHHMLSMDETKVFSNSFCECAMIYNINNYLIIAAIYRPPDAPTKKFEECLQQIKCFKDSYDNANILILGDMNLKYIDWNTETLRKPTDIKQCCTSEERVSSNLLLDFLNENMMIQMVHENTRHGKSLLDLVITNDEDIVFDVKVEKTI